ncbi:MAG: M13 family metallopeptidase [Anaeromyxobacteraceae bacterium]
MSRPFALLALAAALACKTSGAPASGAPPASPPAASPAVRAEEAAQQGPGIDPALIDAAVKPCDDFYAYACGGWLATAQIPPDKAIWSRSFVEIEERNLALLRDLAQADAAGKVDPQDRYPHKVGDFWAACMDEGAIEARGTEDLRAEWAKVDAVKDVPSLAQEVASLHRRGLFPVFRITSDQDAKDATQVIGIIEQGGLSLPDRDYYLKTDAKSAAIQASYREHVAHMLALAGVPQDRAANDAVVIFALERSMAEAHWTRVEMRDPERIYNRVELAGLEKDAPRFPWKAYLDDLGHGGVTAFSTTTPKYLTRLDVLLGTTPPATWQAYLRWKVLSTMAARRALPKAFSEQAFQFTAKNFTGAKEQEARWKHCVKMQESELGEAIGQAYVRRYFGEDGKARTKKLVQDVEGAMGRRLDGVAWMDGPTRARAKEKLGKVDNKVGFPDRWRDYDALAVDRGSFFRSLLAANAFEVNRDLSKIGKPLDRNEWLMTPPQVNAYYNPTMNEMVFPAGILQPPFFHRAASDAVNYGAIGMVVGHELTHGFDDEGRKFDAAGNLTDWWTPAVSTEFDRRAQCVVDQYGEYVADPAIGDVKLNGKLTLGENIADLGGLKLAFSAYRAAHPGQGEPAIAGFTPEQAFFISYAQAWCTALRPEYARLRASIDPHSPPRWRVNGPLANLAEFQQAFSCPAGSPMVRAGAKRCEVW